MKNEESKIIKMAQNGTAIEREIAFAQIFKKYHPILLYKLTTSLGFDSELASDLVSDTMLKVCKAIKSYDHSKGVFSTWINSIAKNVLIDHKRVNKHFNSVIDERESTSSEDDVFSRVQIADTSDNGLEMAVKDERALMVKRAIESIKSDLVRDTMRLRFFDEASYEEIADRLSVPIGTVKGYIFKGKEFVREFLDKREFSFK